jgi:hypothetical protein
LSDGGLPMKRIAVASSIFLLSACAANNNVWNKPGASQTEFAQVKFGCMQQSQAAVSSAYVNQYGGSSQSGVRTNEPLFGACMNAQGWYLGDQRQLQAAAQTTKAGWDAFTEELRELCSREEFQPHFNRSPCKAEDTTLEQMADKSRITPSEKEALSKYKAEYAAIQKRINEYVRQNDPRRANSLLAIRERTSADLDKLAMDFYAGRITRGEYNSKRRDIAQQSAEQWRVATAN